MSTKTFRFHALVTVDSAGNPYGEASTDKTTLEPDGFLTSRFSSDSLRGYGIAEVEFDVEIDDEIMRLTSTPALVGTVVEKKDTTIVIDAETIGMEIRSALPGPEKSNSGEKELEEDENPFGVDVDGEDPFEDVELDDAGMPTGKQEEQKETNPVDKNLLRNATNPDEIDVDLRWLGEEQ